MPARDAKTVGALFFQEQDRLRGGPAAELCAPDYRAIIAGYSMDLAGHQEFAKSFYGAFPDLTHAIETVVAEDSIAVVRFVLRGTHQNSFMGIPASGKRIEAGAIAMIRVDDGRVSQIWGEFDQMGMMRQIGALPAAV
jgi:steroid delta-isomerase-like uncharacterized protein